MSAQTVAIAAAGTGGHVYPALVVAQEMVDRGHEVFFIGGERVEADAVPAAGFALEQVAISGISRTNLASNLAVPGQVVSATRRVRAILRDRGADVLLAMGGYITGPAVLGAAAARIPVVLHEQNVRAGLANRWAAPLARRILVAFDRCNLRRGQVVGNPLRPNVIRDIPRAEALGRYDLGSGPVVGVMGGSQGARIINQAIAGLIEGWSGEPMSVLHLTGSADSVAESTANPSVVHRVVEFEDDMGYFYSASDLVVSRAGAISVSELAATGSPSILVPYSFGAATHQAENAGVLVEAGAAVQLDQTQLESLDVIVADLLDDVDSLASMAQAARSVAVGDAAAVVADIVLEEAARG